MASLDPTPPTPAAPPPSPEPAVASSPLRVVAGVLSVSWLAVAAAYLHLGLAWNVAGLGAGEAVGLVSGFVLPLIVLWQGVLWTEAGRALRREAELLRRQIDQLIYPSAEAEARVNAVTESLRRQASALTTASTDAASRAHAMRVALREKMEEMERISEKVETGFTRAAEALGREAARVDATTNTALGRARDVEARLLAQTKAAAKASETALSTVEESFRRILEQAKALEAGTLGTCERLTGSAAMLSAGIADIRALGEDAATQADAASHGFAESATLLQQALARNAEASTELARCGTEVDASLSRGAETVDAAAARLSQDGERLSTLMREQAERFTAAMQGAVQLGETLAGRVEGCRERVAETLGQLDDRTVALSSVGEHVAGQLAVVSERFDDAGSAMKEAAAGMGEEAESLIRAGEVAADRLDALLHAIENRLQALSNAAERAGGAADGLDDRTASLAERIVAAAHVAAERLASETETLQHAAVAISERAEGAEQAVRVRAQSLSQAVENAASGLLAAAEDAGNRLAPSIERLEIEGTSLRNAVKAGAARIDDAAEAFAARRGELEQVMAELSERFTELTRSSEAATGRADAAARMAETPTAHLDSAARRLEEVLAGFADRTTALLQAIDGQVALLSGAAEASDDTARELAERGAALERTLDRQSESMQAMSARAERAEQEMRARTDTLTVACDGAITALQKASTALAADGDGLVTRVEPLAVRLADLAQNLSARRGELVKASAELLPTGDAACARVGEMARGLGDHLDTLAGLTGRVEALAAELSASRKGFDGTAQDLAAQAAALGAERTRLQQVAELVVEEGRHVGEALAGRADAAVAASEQAALHLTPVIERLELESRSLRQSIKAAAEATATAQALGQRGDDFFRNVESSLGALDSLLERISAESGLISAALDRRTAELAVQTSRLETAAAAADRSLEDRTRRLAAPDQPEPATPSEDKPAGFGLKMLYGISGKEEDGKKKP